MNDIERDLLGVVDMWRGRFEDAAARETALHAEVESLKACKSLAQWLASTLPAPPWTRPRAACLPAPNPRARSAPLTMLDRRILVMPKKGKVVIAHPDKEWPAKMLAASEDLRYFLSPDVVKDAFVLDVSVLKGVWA